MYRILFLAVLCVLFPHITHATDIKDVDGSTVFKLETKQPTEILQKSARIELGITRVSPTATIKKIGVVWKKSSPTTSPLSQTSFNNPDIQGSTSRIFPINDISCGTEYTGTGFIDFVGKDGTVKSFQYANNVRFTSKPCGAEGTITAAVQSGSITQTEAVFKVDATNNSSVDLVIQLQYKTDGIRDFITDENSDFSIPPGGTKSELMRITRLATSTRYEYKILGTFTVPPGSTTPVPNPNTITSPSSFFTTKKDSDPSSVSTISTTPSEKGDDTYTLITPLPLEDGEVVTDVVIGGRGIIDLLNRIFILMLTAAVILAVVFLIIGGSRYATGDSLGSIGSGKETIINALKGLLFALLAWILLNIINPDLLRFTLELENKGTGVNATTTYDGSLISGAGCGSISDAECFNKIKADEEGVRGILRTNGITVNANSCVAPDKNKPGCTNVGLLDERSLNMLITLKKDCDVEKGNCEVVVTGGTEYWLHGSGGNHKLFTAIDLRIGGDKLDSFIRSKTISSTLSFCNATYKYKSFRLCDEKASNPHWHVDLINDSSNQQSGNTTLYVFPGLNVAGYVRGGQALSSANISALVNKPEMVALKDVIYSAAQKEGIDQKLFYALIAKESGGNPNAVSPKNACGLAQMLPGTARDLGLAGTDTEICTKLKTDNAKALELGAKYFKQSITRGGNINNGLARYNGGNQALENSGDCPERKKWECPWDAPGYYNKQNPTGTPLKPLESEDHINTGFSETRFYVINILALKNAIR